MELLETVITNLPSEKSSGFITARFLFGLLKTANILRVPEALRMALEKKIASQLEQATLDDLLMPSYSYLVETLYDVDAVERILQYYLEKTSAAEVVVSENDGEEQTAIRYPEGTDDPLSRVARLVDGFLAEVASDANLRPEKFCEIALSLPDHARVYDDGLYRAVDVYLKAHPGMTEEEKEKVSGVINCRKLTLEACTHAAQNERLPLRSVVQVLFFEQLQLRRAIAGTMLVAEAEDEAAPAAELEEGRRWRAASRENQLLRLGMDSMRNRVQDLERQCSGMRQAIERMDRRERAEGGWGSLGRRFGCKSRMQVRDLAVAAASKKTAGGQHMP
ncbi:hypothetical protein HPP92_018819 [Vanilla planifolia]|uniref:NPH3 domain-containing protein n=1 Tax=Vanilla planifolia TaxID=51239 RepID=A0A835Q7Q1_VANPL|nr:hypothetical protein HPP92_018819 [Vanilla planifolia]